MLIEKQLCIGLFGTCGNSKWREKFIKKYEEMGICYFNPQKKGWKRAIDVKNERNHLENDRIILFPVTEETYGIGSLFEIGHMLAKAIKLNKMRSFVVCIKDDLSEHLDNSILRSESLKDRSLQLEHFKELEMDNVYLVDSLDEMLEVSIKLYEIEQMLQKLEKYNPHRKIDGQDHNVGN